MRAAASCDTSVDFDAFAAVTLGAGDAAAAEIDTAATIARVAPAKRLVLMVVPPVAVFVCAPTVGGSRRGGIGRVTQVGRAAYPSFAANATRSAVNRAGSSQRGVCPAPA